MAKKSSTNFSEADLERMGLVKQADGSYKKLVKDLFGQDKVFYPDSTLIIKDVIKYTPDFNHIHSTEWFIKNYNVPAKKNSRQNFVKNGKQISIPSKIHANYVKMTAMQYEVFGIEFRKAVAYYELKYPLRVEFTFVRDSHRRWDYCNAAQTVEDLIVANKWIEDDSADFLIPVFMPYEYDKNCPGVKIRLITNKQ